VSDKDAELEMAEGIGALWTLLEFHNDVTFDRFGNWVLRNIFTPPANLAVVTPHQAGLDLEATPEREAELLAGIKDLKRQIDDARSYFITAVYRLGRSLTKSSPSPSAASRENHRRALHLPSAASPAPVPSDRSTLT
jgi:hypothetical protein